LYGRDLLRNSHNFVRLNSKVRWEKKSDHRVDKPDYADRAVFEGIANALMHRDYAVIGSEIHIDMYDDRLDIYSPGGMVDGSLIQDWDIETVPSIRRNPTVADIFHRLDFAERQGSGLKRIREETSLLAGYTEENEPLHGIGLSRYPEEHELSSHDFRSGSQYGR
jgi:ATP-dependent DNA helicase RecG